MWIGDLEGGVDNGRNSFNTTKSASEGGQSKVNILAVLVLSCLLIITMLKGGMEGGVVNGRNPLNTIKRASEDITLKVIIILRIPTNNVTIYRRY